MSAPRPALETATMVRAGELSAVDVLEHHLAVIDAGEETVHAFNLVLADRHGAVVIRGLGAGRPEAVALAPGAHMVTAHDVDDIASPRTARHLPRFRAAPAPEPASWGAWQAILADASGPVEPNAEQIGHQVDLTVGRVDGKGAGALTGGEVLNHSIGIGDILAIGARSPHHPEVLPVN